MTDDDARARAIARHPHTTANTPADDEFRFGEFPGDLPDDRGDSEGDNEVPYLGYSDEDLVIVLQYIERLNVDSTCEGTLSDLAQRLDWCDRIFAATQAIASSLQDSIAERMESNEQEAPGVGWLVREQRKSVSWNHEGLRSEFRRDLVRHFATGMDGEVQPAAKRIVEDVWNAIDRSLGFGTPKAAMRKEWNYDLDEWRRTSNAGWKVTLKKGVPL